MFAFSFFFSSIFLTFFPHLTLYICYLLVKFIYHCPTEQEFKNRVSQPSYFLGHCMLILLLCSKTGTGAGGKPLLTQWCGRIMLCLVDKIIFQYWSMFYHQVDSSSAIFMTFFFQNNILKMRNIFNTWVKLRESLGQNIVRSHTF